jgi:ribonucleoside-diphosphate reductase alpha chain
MKFSENTMVVLEKRYLKKDTDGRVVETPEKLFKRVAKNIAKADLLYGASKNEVKKTEAEFSALMRNLEFIPNSPTLMNAGTELQQLSACFVLPIEDSINSIYESIKHTAIIHKSGGGTGFSFTKIRPKGSSVGSTGGVASGPVSFIRVFNASTEAIKQGGRRRGANMGILRVDHPDIKEFITAKARETELTNFNLSVAITDRFMEALKDDADYELVDVYSNEVSSRLPAREVMDIIVEMAWKTGEPGIIFIDRINKANPTPKLGDIESTNPCGEQPLLPWESCNLGSVNLSRFVKNGGVDYERLSKVTWSAVHFLDNVIDMNKYPIKKIEEMTKGNRKIGLGVMGFADLLIMLGLPYDSEEALKIADDAMGFIFKETKKASMALAKKRGSFPNYSRSIYKKKGEKLRNATLTTIAPTGSLSIIANSSSGIEPIFAVAYRRKISVGEFNEVHPLFREMAEKEGFYSEKLIEKIVRKGSIQELKEIPDRVKALFRTAHDIDAEWHIKMQATFQKWVENAVSKTVNFQHSATKKDIRKAYDLAYELGCKGVTVYRDGSREEQVLAKGEPKKPKVRPRPKVTKGMTLEMTTGCGHLYVTVNEDQYGEPFEVFAQLGKGGGCAASQTEAIGRLTSLALRTGIKIDHVAKQLQSISCDRPYGVGKNKVYSCADAVARALATYLEMNGGPAPTVVESKIVGACPDCGASGSLEHEGGCLVCRSCGYTECS